MRTLFDQGTPISLHRSPTGHVVATAYELVWSTVTNGDLIRLAEQDGYELIFTKYTSLGHPQNLKGCTLALLVVTTPSWQGIRGGTGELQVAFAAIESGGDEELLIP